MQSTIYHMNGKGGLSPVATNRFNDLANGTVIRWGGNYGYPETTYCIIDRLPPNEHRNYTVYLCYNMDEPEHNSHLNHVESFSIVKADDPDLWHSQHMYLEEQTVDSATVEQYRQDATRQAQNHEQREAEIKAENDRLESIGRELWPRLIGDCPAVIVAELEHDESDSMVDYFGSRTVDRVILAPSKHTRDLFPEMRKAAELLPETRHLGRDKGRFTPYVVIGQDFIDGHCYYKGQRSPWHGELDRNENGGRFTFTTREEAQAHIEKMGEPEPVSFGGQVIPFNWTIEEDDIEHREKWSMGHGYYLGYDRYSGWQVSKKMIRKGTPSREQYITLAKRHDHLLTDNDDTPIAPKQDKPANNPPVTITLERDWTWLKFAAKPTEAVREMLKSKYNARFSGKRTAWYITAQVNPETLSAEIAAR